MGKKVQIETILRAIARNNGFFEGGGQYSISYESFRFLMLAEDLIVSTPTMKAKFIQLESQGYIYQTFDDRRSRSKIYKINAPMVKEAICENAGSDRIAEEARV